MTEDEAKTKWCCGPPAMVALTINHAADTTNEEPLKCLGSACVAWRWERKYGTNPDKPEDCMELPPTEGFCGLAGRPA